MDDVRTRQRPLRRGTRSPARPPTGRSKPEDCSADTACCPSECREQLRESFGRGKLRDRCKPPLQGNEQRDACNERDNHCDKRSDTELRIGAVHIHSRVLSQVIERFLPISPSFY